MSLKAVSYARVSTLEQKDSGYSIDAQNNLFDEYSSKHNLIIVKKFSEAASASKKGRKDFKKMLQYVKSHNISVVLMDKVDRTTRNLYDQIQVYELVESKNVEFVFIRDGFTLNKESKSQEKLRFDLAVILAKNYANNLSEEVKKGQRQKLLSGGWGHLAPPGYKNVRIEGKAIVVPHQKESVFIKSAFEMAKEGNSIRKICDFLNNKLNKKFYPSKISYLLKNSFYIGINKTKLGVFKGEQELFIEPELFYSVQDALKGRFNSKSGRNRKFKFSGILKCVCGSNMYGEYKKQKNIITYGCGAKHHKKPCDCKPRYMSERKIIDSVISILKSVKITDAQFENIKTIARDVFKKIDEQVNTEIDTLNKSIKIKKTKILKLLDHYEDGLITKDEYFERKDTYAQDITKMQARYEKINVSSIYNRELFLETIEAFTKAYLILPLIDDSLQFQKLIKVYFTNLVHDNGKLDFELTTVGQMLISVLKNDVVAPTEQFYFIKDAYFKFCKSA